MKHKRFLGFLLVTLSLAFIFHEISFNPPGGVVQEYFSTLTISHIFSLIFLMFGLFLLIQRDKLEYLVIPVGLEKWQNSKAKSARKTIEASHVDRVVITGDIDGEKRRYKEHDENKPSVYDAVRKAGIKPGQVRLLRGMDSEEDILYLGEMVRKGDTVYFDTFPLHYQEYKTLIKKAQRDGTFPKGVILRNAKIPQGRTEAIYGTLGWLEEVFKRRPLTYKKNRESESLDKIKDIVKKFIGA